MRAEIMNLNAWMMLNIWDKPLLIAMLHALFSYTKNDFFLIWIEPSVFGPIFHNINRIFVKHNILFSGKLNSF